MLDLAELTQDWDCPDSQVAARIVTGRDGADVIQMRIELGMMQMFPDGRPDAATYGGMGSALEFVENEQRHGRPIPAREWRELERELLQRNYRRMAYASLGEQSLASGDIVAARQHLSRAVRDIATCLGMIHNLREHGIAGSGAPGLQITLHFHHTRLAAQLLVMDGEYDRAIDLIEDGATALEAALVSCGVPPEQVAVDSGLSFLRESARLLRRDYHIPLTLRERLEDALARDDFELASILRDQLRRRDEQRRQGPSERST